LVSQACTELHFSSGEPLVVDHDVAAVKTKLAGAAAQQTMAEFTRGNETVLVNPAHLLYAIPEDKGETKL
jgi:hypothetical protein